MPCAKVAGSHVFPLWAQSTSSRPVLPAVVAFDRKNLPAIRRWRTGQRGVRHVHDDLAENLVALVDLLALGKRRPPSEMTYRAIHDHDRVESGMAVFRDISLKPDGPLPAQTSFAACMCGAGGETTYRPRG